MLSAPLNKVKVVLDAAVREGVLRRGKVVGAEETCDLCVLLVLLTLLPALTLLLRVLKHQLFCNKEKIHHNYCTTTKGEHTCIGIGIYIVRTQGNSICYTLTK